MSLHREREHPEYVEGCFGCKISTLQVGTGDANSSRLTSSKKFEAELDAYKKARADGIQPSGSTMKAIKEAEKASDTLGKAYQGDKMPKANLINNRVAKTMNEVGI